MQVALVVNPVSGASQGELIAGRAERTLREHGHEVVRIRGHDGPSTRAALSAAADGLDTVVVVGGDGALHDVLPLLADSHLTLGLLPAGTGNDTARALGLPRDEEAALRIVLEGRARRVDLAHTAHGDVATVVASGFDSKVNERANAMRWPRGPMRYNLAIVAELRTFSPLPFEIELDGTTIRREAMLVAVGNGPSFGGGLRIAEGAVIDDGLLDVCIINPVSKVKLVRVFPRLSRGTHVDLPEFERHRVRTVRLASPDVVAYGDGERLGPLPLEVRVRPGALRVLVAPGP